MGTVLGRCENGNLNISCTSLGSSNSNLDLEKVGKMDDSYDFDLIILGGGSGGIAAGKEASKLGARVALCDYVKPSPKGSQWGLGGTCVNVGCIPKKLLHQASNIGQSISDASNFGWVIPNEKNMNWPKLINSIQNYIGSLNWGYKTTLKQANISYANAFAEFVDEHTILTTSKSGSQQTITSKYFLIAVGGRPKYPNIEGAIEHAITSDDLFTLPYNPGKTLCVGASYIALECAGFLAGFGMNVTVMARSILLGNFDRQLANLVGESLERHGVRFIHGFIPISITLVEEGTPPTLRVKAIETEGEEYFEEDFNTVIFAIGRDPSTKNLKLENVGVEINESNGKIYTDVEDRTNIENIFAIGDVAENRPELTPVAIQAGTLLARRLFKESKTLTDYETIPTTIFTPLEYGCVGLSEEAALERYGEEDIEVYHSFFQPLESTLPKRDENKCYAKLICVKSQDERVVGLHYLGPSAGEVTQGFALGIRLGSTKADFDALVGIHPTCAEIFTTLKITKVSGISPLKRGC